MLIREIIQKRNFWIGSIPLILTILIVIAKMQSKDARIESWRSENKIVLVVSWFLVFLISVLAGSEIRDVLESSRPRRRLFRANLIALMISLVMIVILFQQPYLNRIFGSAGIGFWLGIILFGGGSAVGWLVWYLRIINRYGEFCYVLLLGFVVGLCWYARLSAPEEIQITAVAFVLGSLFRIAKDYMDEEARETSLQI